MDTTGLGTVKSEQVQRVLLTRQDKITKMSLSVLSEAYIDH